MKNLKGFSPIIIIVAVVAVLILIVAFLAFGKNTNIKEVQQTPQRQETTNPIRNSSDLDAAEADLDSTNLDEIDSELNQLDSDSATF